MKTVLGFILIISFSIAQKSDQGLIYGTVTLTNGNEYTGTMRWGKAYGKEHFWMDMFNSSKMENDYEDLVDYREYRRNRRNSFFGIRIGDHDRLTTHQFVCMFGDIKTIVPYSSSKAEIILKNNESYEVSGSDAGATVYLIDETDGEEYDFKWRRIERIEFKDTPDDLKYAYDRGLYGIVQTEVGKFEGLIQWDYDESIMSDELNGDEGDYEFNEIKRIEKESRRRTIITTHNGRERSLSGTNDVDDDNRGIVVKVKDVGMIEIRWREFEYLEFKNTDVSGMKYSDFKPAKKLYADITLEDGEKISGRIAYDLDETYDIETIDGEMDDLEYNIPIRNIESIENTGRDAARVRLKNGTLLKLYDLQDVSDRNDGILIWVKDKEDPKYIPWRDIELVKFQ
jgi:hypothetical protein